MSPFAPIQKTSNQKTYCIDNCLSSELTPASLFLTLSSVVFKASVFLRVYPTNDTNSLTKESIDWYSLTMHT